MFCLISHTHWDREWYMPFEGFRLKLVDLIDHLIKIIEEYPDYVFHLDAQTIVLEDYLEIRPEMADTLKKYITNGNIMVGPWYLQNDFLLTSGESTIRNLLEGRRIARSFGHCDTVGYAPDQFGNISQLPQILRGFGIDNFVFGRGYNCYARREDGSAYMLPDPLEFQWEGPDGSRVLAVNLRCWYNNAQRIPPELELAKQMTDRITAAYNGIISTEYYLLMNGVDHLEAQSDLLPIVKAYNEKYAGEDGVMQQYRLCDYIDKVKESLEKRHVTLTTWNGELRRSPTNSLLTGTFSSRHYLKIANVKAQNTMEQLLEPLYSMLELAGCRGVYSWDHFRHGWKMLMKNHPHDSICGCSRDAVHDHMEDNFRKIKEFTDEWLRRGLQEACYHSDLLKNQPGCRFAIGVVNTTGRPLSGILPLELDFPRTAGVNGYKLVDQNGKELPFALTDRIPAHRDEFSAINLPGKTAVDRHCVYVQVEDVPAYSFYGIAILPADTTPAVEQRPATNTLENDALRVTVDKHGRVDVLCKKTGKLYEDVLYLEDRGDHGDSYIFTDAGSPAILSQEFTPAVTPIENNAFTRKMRIEWALSLPAAYDFAAHRRTGERNTVSVRLDLQLDATDDMLRIGFTVDNTCCDHRLRLVFRTDFAEALCLADTAFDIIPRDIVTDKGIHTEIFPNASFVTVEQEGNGLAILTEGTHETEHVEPGVVALTLVRSTGVISRASDDASAEFGQAWDCAGNQSLRTISGRLALLPYTGTAYTADLPNRAIAFRTGLQGVFFPTDRRIFNGGRPFSGEPSGNRLYYPPDAYPDALLSDRASLLSVEGDTIAVSCLKLADDQTGLILRFYNYGTEAQTATVKAAREIFRTDMGEDSRLPLGRDCIELPVKPKEIITLYLK